MERLGGFEAITIADCGRIHIVLTKPWLSRVKVPGRDPHQIRSSRLAEGVMVEKDYDHTIEDSWSPFLQFRGS
ncbi:MAG: hypothetical protein RMI45_07910 [Ignisphaera sp.]|nr:hypothetical protein [Ignisphaera sp.]MDW8086140.1 hypothetical protein [Ignisphaera sp.]